MLYPIEIELKVKHCTPLYIATTVTTTTTTLSIPTYVVVHFKVPAATFPRSLLSLRSSQQHR